MSLEVLIIPLGMWAWSSARQALRSEEAVDAIDLRISDSGLLSRALDALGAEHSEPVDGVVTVAHRGFMFSIHIGEGGLTAVSAQAARQELLAVVEEAEEAAGRILQAEKVEELRLRAAQLGMRLIGEEITSDGAVELLFEEVGG